MVKSVRKARKRFQEQIEKNNSGTSTRTHGGLAGRPNLNALTADDPEVLRAWKLPDCSLGI